MGNGAGKADGEVNMIGNSTDTVGFTAMIATSGCEVGVEFGGKVGGDKGASILRGKDDVDNDVGE